MPTVPAPGGWPGAPPPFPVAPAALPAPPRPRVWTVFVAFALTQGAALLLGVVVVLALAGMMAARKGGPLAPADVKRVAEGPVVFLVLLGLAAAATGAIALVAASLGAEPVRSRLALARARTPVLATAVACAGGVGLALAFESLSSALRLRPSDPLRVLGRAIEAGAGTGEQARVTFLLSLAVVAVLAPVGEELLYRGYVQRRLVQRWGAVAGIAVTAALFGAAHLDRLQSPFAAALGLLLGWVTVRSGSILPALLGHAAVNGWGVIATRLGLSPASAGTSAAVGLLGLALLASAVAVGRKRLGTIDRPALGAAGGPTAPAPPVA